MLSKPGSRRNQRESRPARPREGYRPKTQFLTMLAVAVPLLFFFGLFNSKQDVPLAAVPWWGWLIFGLCEIPLVISAIYLRATEPPLPQPPRHDGTFRDM